MQAYIIPQVLTAPDLYYVAACFAFIISAVICGVIRWGHMCHPYDERADYFYPARKQVAVFYGAAVLQFPYLLSPHDSDTWFYICSFGVIYYALMFSMMFMRYFDRKKLYYSKFGKVCSCISIIYLAVLFSTTFINGRVLTGTLYNVAYASSIIIGVALTVLCLIILSRLKRRIDVYHYNNFSSEDDFPYKFAVKIVYMPLLWLLVMWIIFLSECKAIKSIFDIVAIFWTILFLLMILHPQRSINQSPENEQIKKVVYEETEKMVEQEEQEAVEEQEKDEELHLSASGAETANKDEDTEAIKAIKDEIESIIVGKKRFLDTRYNLDALADEITLCGRTKLSKICSKHMNGFYYIVNRPRVEFAEEYKREHPCATKQEIALASGFTSRDNYKHAIDVVEKINKKCGL